MKIILTENQIVRLKEQRVQYTPEKISQIVSDAVQKVAKIKNLISNFYVRVSSMTLSDILSNENETNQLLSIMNDTKNKIDELSNRYYKMTELYEYPYENENVTKLEDISTEMDNHLENISNLIDVLSDVLNYKEKLNRIN